MSARQPSVTPNPAPRFAPPGRSSASGAGTLLPRSLTPLIARDQEVAAVAALLRDPDVRLLTLTGPGGVGKTRLAIAAAGEAQRFTDGAVFVDLSPVGNPGLVPNTIASCLSLRETGPDSLLDRLATAIGSRNLLLLLDNFEHVVVAAPWLLDLLDACPELRLLVTSRIRLRLSGEREFPVAPLPLNAPAVADVGPSGAIRLFIDRAQAIRPDLSLGAESMPAVSEIVRRVDGLPLAIELAAARIKALPPAALLQRLEQRLPLLSGGARDLPLRQQTMRDTIGWSYDLLDDGGRALFRRLSVFVGGFTLDAAEAIGASARGGPGATDRIEVIDGVTELIEHSLLRQVPGTETEPRYQMLETVREFALDRLVASREHDLMQRRHVAWFLAIAESGLQGITGPIEPAWLDRLDRERDNLRAALRWSLDRGDAETATRLGAALWRFWERRRELIEGREHLRAILALPPDPALLAPRSGAFTGAGVIATLQADYDQATRYAEDALAGWRSLGDRQGAARALLCLSTIARYRDDYASAEALGQEALAAFDSIGDRWGVGRVLANLGMVAWVQGDRATGTARYEQALTHLRDVGDEAGVFEVVLELGKGASDAGDMARATTLLEECLALSESMGDGASRGETLTELGVVALHEGDHARAAELFMQATTLAKDNGDRRQLAWLASHRGDVDAATGATASAATGYAEALGLFLSMENRVGIAQGLEAIARCAALRGRATPAIRLLGSSAALFGEIGAAAPPGRDPAESGAALRQEVPPMEFDQAWAAGLALDPGAAGAEALELAADIAAEGDVVARPAADTLPPPAPGESLGLTPREIEVLHLLTEGLSDREIAEALSISERTAGNHVQHAMQKIGVESRTAAAVYAVRHNLA